MLADWLAFDGKDIFPAPQEQGDPRISGSLQSQYRTESEMELRDALTFRIAAAVVDIRPNGNLVIEARREIRINEEVWVQSLTGVVRRQSIGPGSHGAQRRGRRAADREAQNGLRQRRVHARLVRAVV